MNKRKIVKLLRDAQGKMTHGELIGMGVSTSGEMRPCLTHPIPPDVIFVATAHSFWFAAETGSFSIRSIADALEHVRARLDDSTTGGQ